MRLLHTADLHLGKTMNDFSFLEDQKAVLDQILSYMTTENADVLVIAGDVYQKAQPPAEAMVLFDDFLTAIAALGKKVFVISGNHDSAQRVSYMSRMVRDKGVYITESFDGTLQRYSVKDPFGEVVFSLLPFVKPAVVKHFLPGEKIVTCQDAVQAVLKNMPVDKKKRNVLLCHQFITGAQTSESEEAAVGGLDNIDADIFREYDYVALGHIHKPQRAGGEYIRYSGSPLKYSFDEEKQRKGILRVDIEEKGHIEVKELPLYPMHDVRRVRGSLDALLQMDYSEDLIWATVTDEDVLPDTRNRLYPVFPNLLKFSVDNSHTKVDMDILARESMEDKTAEELFCDFYRLQCNNA